MFIHDTNPEEGGGEEIWNFRIRLIIDMVDGPRRI
jgi:hypothetical protein